jgi:adenylate cyclase
MARLEKDDSRIRVILDADDRILEIGRQTKDDPDPPAIVLTPELTRLVIVPKDHREVGRRQLRIEVLDQDRVRLTNVNEVNGIALDSGSLLAPGKTTELTLPFTVHRGSVGVSFEAQTVARRSHELSYDDFFSLPAAPPAPNSEVPVFSPSHFEISENSSKKEPESLSDSFRSSNKNLMFERLGKLVQVLQRAAAAKDFEESISRTALEMVGLDRAAVLKRAGSTWRISALSMRHDNDDESWRPSQGLLGMVAKDRRTVWGIPGADGQRIFESVASVVAMVAAPILNNAGEVVGAVYGDRRFGAGLNRTPIDKFDAMMVEIMACGVAGGWARLEQEQAALTRRVQLERFVTKEVAQRLEDDPDALLGRDADVTILFCDIVGFSRISEQLSPAKTFEWINAVMEILSECVSATKGTLVDYIGDELIAMWGAPLPISDHASAAAESAIQMLNSLKNFNQKYPLPEGELTQIGIGLNTGKVRVGNTGSVKKLKYGPLGSEVNIASRVQGATRFLRAPALITGATARQIEGKFRTRRLCAVRLKNIENPVDLYELVASAGPEWNQLVKDYEIALKAWEEHKLQTTIGTLSQVVAREVYDGPTMVLLSRAVDAWSRDQHQYDPVWTLPSK